MKGSCLCGEVEYEIDPPFRGFQYCHCTRCQKFTGSAHASNIFVAPEQFRWLAGEENVSRFDYPNTKYFATCFCQKCGSNLPWAVQTGNNVVVPAGSLNEDPGVRPNQNIFWEDKAPWYDSPCDLTQYAQFPPRK